MGGNTYEYDVQELYKWIDTYELSRPKRNISRDFSDAIPLAEILKKHYPKLVELHNYTPCNSVSQKLVNWKTLNKRVLSKLDINLSNTIMEQLSQSLPAVIENILFDVKEKIESKTIDRSNQEVYFIEGLPATVSGTVIPIRQKDSLKPLNHKVIPEDTYTKMETNLEEKDNKLNELMNKLQHLESLLLIKDERINDLTRQIEQLSNSDSSLALIKGGSKFFTKLF